MNAEHTELRAMIERASGLMEQRFAKTGVILPMWHAVTADGQSFVMPPPHHDKDISAALVRALFELRNVVRCLLIDEAWTLEGPLDQEAYLRAAARAGLEHHPKRKEIVMFAGEDETGALRAHRPIIRPAQGKARLGPLEIVESGGVSEGRFVGMLPRKGMVS